MSVQVIGHPNKESDPDVLKDILPKEYIYRIEKNFFVNKEQFLCEIRCNILNGDEFKKWLKEFEEITDTWWIYKSSVSTERSRFLFSRNYVCHHSSYGKKRGHIKDKKCTASLFVRIKRNNKFTRYRDPLLKDGFFAIIKINFHHSHEIDAAESLKWLPRSEETKKIFSDLFDHGLTPCAAKSYYESLLLSESPELLGNSRFNPPPRWIYQFHRVWEKSNLEFNQEYDFNSSQIGMIFRPHCCVPGCKSGSLSERERLKKEGKEHFKLFVPPLDCDIFEEWKKALSVFDFELTRNNHVCELHFHENELERFFGTKLQDGSMKKNGRLLLKPEAVPSIFPSASEGTSSKVLKKIPLMKSSIEQTASKNKNTNEHLSEGNSSENNFSYKKLFKTVKQTKKKTNEKTVKKPNDSWSVTATPEFIIFARCNEEYTVEKKVVIEDDLTARVFLREREISNYQISSTNNLSTLLCKVELYTICAAASDKSIVNCRGYTSISSQPGEKPVWCKYCLHMRRKEAQKQRPICKKKGQTSKEPCVVYIKRKDIET